LPPPSDLSRRLHALLKRQGFSISEAARQAGMQKQATWLIVTGRNRNPGVETVRRIVEAAGATMGELFADED
jgi:transcriptional regulator with XRE-family HTH domain